MLPDRDVTGHLRITSEDGHLFATLDEVETALPGGKELLPRLWSPVIVSCRFGSFVLRGLQRQSGRLCAQEWECSVLGRQR